MPEYSDLTLTVIGAKGADSDEIDSFECVNNLFEDILANVDEAETLKEKADLLKVLKLY